MADEVANPDWTPAENWAWARIAAGRVADFGAEHGTLDPRPARPWGPKRTLSAGFLRAVLFERRWAEKVPAEGVRIAGARWKEPLLIPHARLAWPLCLDGCRFGGAVDMSDLAISGRLSFTGSAFHGGGRATPGLRLDMASAQRADLSGGYFRHGAAAIDATFVGILDLSRASLDGELNLAQTKARFIRLREGAFAGIVLSNCQVDHDLDLSGASVAGPIKMNDAQIGQDLWLGGSKSSVARFAGAIDLTGARVDGILSMCGMTAHAPVDMQGIEVRKNIFMRKPAKGDDERETGETIFLAGIELSYCLIHGYLDMTAVQVGKKRAAKREPAAEPIPQKLDLSMARIMGSALLSGAKLRLEASFIGARISGTLDLSGAQLEGALNLRDARLDGSLWLYAEDKVQALCRGELALGNATIGGSAVLGMLCEGPANCSGLHAGSLFTRSGPAVSPVTPVFKQAIELSHATIDGICDFEGARIEASLTLKRAKVGGELRLGGTFAAPAPVESATGEVRPPPVVDLSESTIEGQLTLTLPLASTGAGREHHLDLRDASARSLRISGPAAGASWPAPGSVQLDGFTFDRLSTVKTSEHETDGGEVPRSVPWLRRWLALDKPFSPQPYEQVVAVLRQSGQAEEANQILYEARERVRRESLSRDRPLWGLPRWIGLGLLKIMIGYGIGLRFFYALAWVIGATAVGVAVLTCHPPLPSSATRLDGLPDLIAYSFDQLLPIIELSKTFGDVKLPHEAEQYFYVLRIFGFLLGAFITAGVAGLTQRSRS